MKRLRFPPVLLDFYAQFMPDEDVDAPVSMLGCYRIHAENTGGSPGIELSRHRIFVFASTGSGDAYCFDTNNPSEDGWPRVVFSSHCELSRWARLTTALKTIIPFARDLPEFLRRYADDKVPTYADVQDESN